MNRIYFGNFLEMGIILGASYIFKGSTIAGRHIPIQKNTQVLLPNGFLRSQFAAVNLRAKYLQNHMAYRQWFSFSTVLQANNIIFDVNESPK